MTTHLACGAPYTEMTCLNMEFDRELYKERANKTITKKSNIYHAISNPIYKNVISFIISNLFNNILLFELITSRFTRILILGFVDSLVASGSRFIKRIRIGLNCRCILQIYLFMMF